MRLHLGAKYNLVGLFWALDIFNTTLNNENETLVCYLYILSLPLAK